MSTQEEVLVDARGHRCPVPTLRLQKALAEAAEGQAVRLLADDPMARIDVPHFLASRGYELLESTAQGEALSFLALKPAAPSAP